MAKNLVLVPIFVPLAQIRATNFFFFKNLNSSVTRYHGQLLSTYYNDPILRKVSDGRTDGQTDRWMKVIS